MQQKLFLNFYVWGEILFLQAFSDTESATILRIRIRFGFKFHEIAHFFAGKPAKRPTNKIKLFIVWPPSAAKSNSLNILAIW